jgi:hypothetical protein
MAQALLLTGLVAATARRSVKPLVYGFQLFDDAVNECKELRPSGMRVFSNESGGMLGEQILASHPGPPTYFPIREESKATEIIGTTSVMEAPEDVLKVQSQKLWRLRTHVAVQHGCDSLLPADSSAPTANVSGEGGSANRERIPVPAFAVSELGRTHLVLFHA